MGASVDALKVRTMPLEALNLNVQGRYLLNPLQGFGPLYRKRYRVRQKRRRLAANRDQTGRESQLSG